MHHAEDPFQLPPQVVIKPLPQLYVYDHCPFCVRVRVALGLKNVKHNLVFLMNDDVDTPTGLVGKKMCPIFEVGTKGQPDHKVMPESMDIVDFIDSDPMFGPVNAIKPSSDRTDIDEWVKKARPCMRRLTSPRYVLSPLPEFHFKDARDAYIRNHAIPEPSDYTENLKMTPEILPEINGLLKELEPMIFSKEHVSEHGISRD
eukprot:CAMPEP_0182448830 /NCGR_PEP_ID=MMETSP1172-20130603/30125_1 /TAXON_ID=708627 /ORGANISM="Timspurckia oligopyrenoides, Strain CCMP3278" /LENGTH=201 /DNA_ID=CAMNT_0024645853 /DNA_START=182 /DNA_END=784 /DNA_ORIENTATION=+